MADAVNSCETFDFLLDIVPAESAPGPAVAVPASGDYDDADGVTHVYQADAAVPVYVADEPLLQQVSNDIQAAPILGQNNNKEPQTQPSPSPSVPKL